MLSKFSRVLVVDDSATMRKLVVAMLSDLNVEKADQAGDGRSALDMLCLLRYTAIICDWRMEPMDGLELFRQTRRRPILAETPFLMMTAHAASFAEIARRDPIACLPKPFTKEALTSKLNALCLASSATQNRAAI